MVHHLLNGWVQYDANLGFALLVFGLINMAFWLAAFQSCWANETPVDTPRRKWLLLILLLGPIGAFAYLLIRRPQRIRELGW